MARVFDNQDPSVYIVDREQDKLNALKFAGVAGGVGLGLAYGLKHRDDFLKNKAAIAAKIKENPAKLGLILGGGIVAAGLGSALYRYNKNRSNKNDRQ